MSLENKPIYFYTTLTGNEEQDTAFFKRLDTTGIRWRCGELPSEYTEWRKTKEYDIVLGYQGSSLSTFLPNDPNAVFQQVSADVFIEAARKKAEEQ